MTISGQQLSLFDVQTAKKDEKQQVEERLTMRYKLFDLPTAQHKAGLAGLLVMIESLKRRGIGPLPEISGLGSTGVTITVTRESMQLLFDDLFAAEVVEVKKKDKVTEKTRPVAKFLGIMGMPERWQTLWKDVVTQVLRAGAPAAMMPYRDRLPSAKKSKLMEWEKLWESLKKKQVGKLSKSDITMSSSDMIGVEAANAEMVPYEKLPEESLLLYFWPITTLPYVTQKLDRPKSGKTKDYLFSYYNYAIVVPEISSLDEFVEDIFDLYPQCLDDTTIGKAPRPKQAVITTLKEAALIFASQKYEGQVDIFPVPGFVSSLNVTHIRYGKGSLVVLENSTVVPDSEILRRYQRISSAYFNPFFKAQIITSMLTNGRWYEGAHALFSHHPKDFFVYSVESPKNIPGYYRDSRKKFTDIKEGLEHMEDKDMETEEGRYDLLANRLYDMVRHYVRIKAENKSGHKIKEFKKNEQDKTIYPSDYREAIEKVCMDAFLAMRGRREQDLVEYFTGTICSVPQFLPEKDYLLISSALIDDWEKVKALSMLAISASSYISNPKQNTKGEQS